ncbi:hypothetical protein ACFLYA_00660 [Candidatus Dependentiae bacterium]
MNKKITSFVLLGLLLGSFAQMQHAGCAKVAKVLKTTTIGVVTAGLLASVFRFYMKEPDGGDIRFKKEIFNDALISRDHEAVLEQLWYFYDDVIIGKKGKRPSIRVAEDGEKLDIRPGAMPVGLCGYAHMYFIPLAKTIGFMALVGKFIKDSEKGLNIWKYMMGLDSDIYVEIE